MLDAGSPRQAQDLVATPSPDEASDVRRAFADGRFVVRRPLGAGAFGAVFEAYDNQHKARVALKTLTRVDPTQLYRFKREFRALQDVVHPNLVTLYELISEGDEWYFTMEYVEGVDFMHDVRPGEKDGLVSASMATGETPVSGYDATMEGTVDGLATGEAAALVGPSSSAPLDEARLRSTFKQLVGAVHVLHQAGHLHRDLKPSNVRVTPPGRVVILDFGLVTSVSEASEGGHNMTLAGTPAYMAPEQARAEAATEASDWYALGVMLFEALTGELPFDGTPMQMLLARQGEDGPAPSTRNPDVPADLDRLCAALLRCSPDARPSGEELLAVLGIEPHATPVRSGEFAIARGLEPFVGRVEELAVLAHAFAATHDGGASVVLLAGLSGMGKTALGQQFLAITRDEYPHAIVLEGRCYQQESVPYKGLDAVVDALSRHLDALREDEVRAVLPVDVQALAQLFPVLRRVATVASAEARVRRSADEFELRQRAFAALRELLQRVAARAPLIVVIDDVQWGDADSATLLAEVLQPPGAPAMLVVVTYRSDEAASSLFLQRFEPQLEKLVDTLRCTTIKLGPLAESETRELARRLIPESGDVGTVVRESEGNPFFLGELVWYAKSAPESGSRSRSLDDVVEARLASMPEAERRLFEIVAVAGQSVAEEVAIEAAEIGEDASHSIAGLRASHLIRGRAGHEGRIETYHDRIREALLGRMERGRSVHCHTRLAHALEGRPDSDPEQLARHLRACGEPARALPYAIQAAERAQASLAFEHAARLFGEALALLEEGSARRFSLTVEQAKSLSYAGRGAEAAEVYLDAACTARAEDTFELRRLAADGFLKSGRLERGKALAAELLAELGVRLPNSEQATMRAAIFSHLRLKLRGFGYQPRPIDEVPSALLRRADAIWTFVEPMLWVEPVFAFALANRYMRLALETGQADRIAQGMYALAAVHASMKPQGKELQTCLRLGAEAGERCDGSQVRGIQLFSEGIVNFFVGDFLRCYDVSREAITFLQQQCLGTSWEQGAAAISLISAMQWLGRWRELVATLQTVTRDALQRGDFFGAIAFVMTFGGFPALVAGRPEEAMRVLDEHLTGWAGHYALFEYVHTWETIGRAYILLYQDPLEAIRFVDERWPVLKKTGALDTVMLFCELQYVRTNALIAAASQCGERRARARLEKRARACLRTLRRKKLGVADLLAAICAGSLAAATGEVAAAMTTLLDAEQRAEAQGMGTHAAAARRLRGKLTGGEAGDALMRSADQALAAEGVADPARFAAIFAPGA